jgi:hypothetical protein
MIRYLIVDTEIDPNETGSQGMSAAFVRNSKDRVMHTTNIEKARRWRDSRNDGIDEGEPGFSILEIDTETGAQRLVS